MTKEESTKTNYAKLYSKPCKFSHDFTYNYGTKDFKKFRGMSEKERKKELSNWDNIALHPILALNDTWLILFEDMSERQFFENLKKQEILSSLSENIANVRGKIKTCRKRIQEFSEEDKENKITKFEKLKRKEIKLQERLTKLENHFEKTKKGKHLCIAIDANNINEKYINKIISICNKLHAVGYKEIKILVSSSDKSINSKIEYLYSIDQLKYLSKLNEQLEYYNKENNFPKGCEMKFSELFDMPKDIFDYSTLHNYDDVLKANDFIENIRITIENKKFTPLEAVIYTYQTLTNTFYYNKDNSIDDDSVHTIIGALKEKQLITCAGISSFFKSIMDVLNNDYLKTGFLSIEEPIEKSSHTFNIISIKDSHYGINGTYAMDLTADIADQKDEEWKGFSGCLVKLKNAIKLPDCINILCDTKTRIDETYFDFEIFMRERYKQKHTMDNKKLKTYLTNSLEKTNDLISQLDQNSKEISCETIIKAYLNVLDKLGLKYNYKNIEEIIQYSTLNTLLYSTKKTKSSWLDLLNIEPIAEEFGQERPKHSINEIQRFANKKMAMSLVDITFDSQEVADIILNPRNKNKYFSAKYFKLLEQIKKHINYLEELKNFK